MCVRIAIVAYAMHIHLLYVTNMCICIVIMCAFYYAIARREGAIRVAFVRPSVAYIANNSRIQRPSVSKFGRKIPHH